MKTREEIITKINEYYKYINLLKERDVGFVDALRWVIEEQEES